MGNVGCAPSIFLIPLSYLEVIVILLLYFLPDESEYGVFPLRLMVRQYSCPGNFVAYPVNLNAVILHHGSHNDTGWEASNCTNAATGKAEPFEKSSASVSASLISE